MIKYDDPDIIQKFKSIFKPPTQNEIERIENLSAESSFADIISTASVRIISLDTKNPK